METYLPSKEIGRELQSRMIAVQLEMLEAASSLCIHCGRRKDSKDRLARQFRTVFEVIRQRRRQFIFCTCRGGKARNESYSGISGSSTTSVLRYPMGWAMNWTMPRDGRSGFADVDLAEKGLPRSMRRWRVTAPRTGAMSYPTFTRISPTTCFGSSASSGRLLGGFKSANFRGLGSPPPR
jgi:hypothetical protein